MDPYELIYVADYECSWWSYGERLRILNHLYASCTGRLMGEPSHLIYIVSLLLEMMAGCPIRCHLCCCILTWPYILCYNLSGYFPWRCSHGRYCYHSQLWGCDYILRLLCTTLSLTQSSVWRGCVVLPVLQFSIILHGGWCLFHHMIPVELSWHLRVVGPSRHNA